MIKLVAIDLDGTLLNHKKDILADNIIAINQAVEQGVKVVVCTGRPFSGTKPYYEQLGFTHDEYLILNNGCSTYTSRDWELLHSHTISIDDVNRLQQLVQKFENIYVTLTTESHFYVIADFIPDIVAFDANLVFMEAEMINLEQVASEPEMIFEAMLMGDQATLDLFEANERQQLAQDYSVVRSQDYLFEVLPKGITKASALKALTEDLAIKPEEVMAIGDAANDLEMLNFAGTGIAMGNASELVKEKADDVTLDCDHAGVAKAIQKYILKH